MGIDPFKVNAAILLGVQNTGVSAWPEHKMQMATWFNNLSSCQNTLVVQ